MVTVYGIFYNAPVGHCDNGSSQKSSMVTFNNRLHYTSYTLSFKPSNHVESSPYVKVNRKSLGM